MEQEISDEGCGSSKQTGENFQPGVPDCCKHHLPSTATAHLMPTHAGHKHIILVQILKTDWASEHTVLVPPGAVRSALDGTALCPCPWWLSCPWRHP